MYTVPTYIYIRSHPVTIGWATAVLLQSHSQRTVFYAIRGGLIRMMVSTPQRNGKRQKRATEQCIADNYICARNNETVSACLEALNSQPTCLVLSRLANPTKAGFPEHDSNWSVCGLMSDSESSANGTSTLEAWTKNHRFVSRLWLMVHHAWCQVILVELDLACIQPYIWLPRGNCKLYRLRRITPHRGSSRVPFQSMIVSSTSLSVDPCICIASFIEYLWWQLEAHNKGKLVTDHFSFFGRVSMICCLASCKNFIKKGLLGTKPYALAPATSDSSVQWHDETFSIWMHMRAARNCTKNTKLA
jgi:hypothetical protein